MGVAGRVAGLRVHGLSRRPFSNLIRENKTFRIDSAIQTGKKYGMQLLDDHLWKLYDDGLCAGDECLERARQPGDFQAKMDAKARGQAGALGTKGSYESQLDKDSKSD